MIIQRDSEEKKIRLPTVTLNGVYGFFGDYKFLSNFHPCKVSVNGWTYHSSEAAYMAEKCTDPTIRAKLSTMTNPGTARKFGQTIPLREDWETYRVLAMMKVLLHKFYQNSYLAKLLLETKNKYLEETNDWEDEFWGVCNNVEANMLGQCLMAIRDNLSLEKK